jgi:hypothetical protein
MNALGGIPDTTGPTIEPMPALLPEDFMPSTDHAWPDYTAGRDGSRVWYPREAGG